MGLTVWTCAYCNHVIYSQASRCPACGKPSPTRESSAEVIEWVSQRPADEIYRENIEGAIYSVPLYEWAEKAPAQQDLAALPDYCDPNSATADAISKAKHLHQREGVEYWDSTFGESEDVEPRTSPAKESRTAARLKPIWILASIALCLIVVFFLFDYLIRETQFLAAAQSFLGLIAVVGIFSILGRLFLGNEDEEGHDVD